MDSDGGCCGTESFSGWVTGATGVSIGIEVVGNSFVSGVVVVASLSVIGWNRVLIFFIGW